MGRPLIAVVGSVDPTRSYDPPLRHPERAPAAAAALGRELARQGCDIVVYSSKPQFIEADVVHGYVESGAAQPHSIKVRSPQGAAGGEFVEAKGYRELFDPRPDTSGDWEVAYFRSLVEVQGVLLIGGGRSTFITGLIAIAFETPLVAVTAFGGNAVKVWQALDRVRNDAEPADLDLMGTDWREGDAGNLITSLLGQHERREHKREQRRLQQHRQQRRAAVSLTIAGVLLLLGLATIPATYAWQPGSAGNITALVAAPLLAAPCGAIIRNTFDQGQEWWRTAILGLAAGAIAGLLFIAAQLATTPGVLDSPEARRLLFFVLPVGFTAGLTFDAVYAKLRREDVTVTAPLKP